MNKWKELSIGNSPIGIIDGDRGKNYPKKNEFQDSGYCLFLNTKNVTSTGFSFTDTDFISKEKDEHLRKGKLQRFDTVLTTRGTVGNIGFYNDQVLFNNIRINSGMVILRPKVDEITPEFLYYTLRSIQRDIDVFTSGSAQPQLPIRDINQISILLPPLPEQKAIASVLSSLDDKIDLLHRQNKTLESMAETLFRQWFVEDSDQEKCSLVEIVNFNPIIALKKGIMAPYLEMANVSTNTFHPDDWYIREFSSGTRFTNRDTLLARITPCLENGKTCYVTFLLEDGVGWGSTEYIVLRVKERIHPFFAYCLVTNNDFHNYAEICMEGSSGRQRVNLDYLKEYEINRPKDESIAEFNRVASSIEPRLIHNYGQIQILTSLRNTLLPKLMSGEVRIEVKQ